MSKKKIIISVISALFVVAIIVSSGIGVNYYIKNTQKPVAENNLSSKQQDIIMMNYEPFEKGEKKKLKRQINSQKPLNLVNFYGNEPILDLWSSIPENQKPYTVLLLIPGHTLLPGSDEALAFLEENADICEANKIPYSIQNVNGEIAVEERLPIAYLESRFASKHSYFYGLNAAELYNSINWRGEIESNNSQYIIDCINLVSKYGAFFFWTDTNMNYDSGMVLEWFENNEAFYSAFKNNSENIALMNKESYGKPSTYACMQGLWLAGLVGNWGVASDWWHWQVDGDKQSLFGEFDEYVDDEWDQILSFPENMYVQSMMLVMSKGGTCFKAEAPNFSTSISGKPVGGFEYGISPLLDQVLSGKIAIPTREQVLKETPLVVSGMENYPEFNYNYDESNLYPSTGKYGIIPLVPKNLRLEERDLFNDNGIVLVDKKENEKFYNSYFADIDSDTFMTLTANNWYFINNVENAKSEKYASVKPIISRAKSMTIKAQEHTSAIITENNDSLVFYLSNYRTDKSEMVKKITPKYRENKSWVEVCNNFLVLDDKGNPVGVDDSKKRTTQITVTGTLNGGEPEIEWLNNADGTGYQNRPYTVKKDWNSKTNTLKLTINHNGVVNFKVKLDNSNKTLQLKDRNPIEPTVLKNDNSVKQLEDYVSSLNVKDKCYYNDYSYLKFNSALEKAKIVISEGTYTDKEIKTAYNELEKSYNNLLDISKYIQLLKDTKSSNNLSKDASLNFDMLLREVTSNNLYVDGRSSKIDYAKLYSKKSFDTDKKVEVLDSKYEALLNVKK